MISKIWLINAVLLVALALLGVETYGLWTRSNEIPAETTGVKAKVDTKKSAAIVIKKNNLKDVAAYETVVVKNLFAPDRKEFVPEESEPEPEPVVEAPPESAKEKEPEVKLNRDIILYGVVIMNDYKTALVSDPGPPPEKNTNTKSKSKTKIKSRIKKKKAKKPPGKKKSTGTLIVKENDPVGGFTVKEILKDRIVLVASNELYEVLLYDEEKPDREIITPKRSTPKPILGKAKGTQAVNNFKKQGPATTSQAKPSKPKKKKVEYINTPFGKIKRIN